MGNHDVLECGFVLVLTRFAVVLVLTGFAVVLVLTGFAARIHCEGRDEYGDKKWRPDLRWRRDGGGSGVDGSNKAAGPDGSLGRRWGRHYKRDTRDRGEDSAEQNSSRNRGI